MMGVRERGLWGGDLMRWKHDPTVICERSGSLIMTLEFTVRTTGNLIACFLCAILCKMFYSHGI